MSRLQRLHVPGGTYYVIQHGNTRQPIFSQPEDYTLFERLLANALRRTDTRVHAYCWTPEDIRLVVQIREISVGRFMQGITSRYACQVHKRAGGSGHFFPQRYKAVLIDPDAYLLKLIHYVHHVPELAGLAGNLGAHAFTSHGAYLHGSASPWLTTRTALRLIERRHGHGGYTAFMSREPAEEDIHLFASADSTDLRVIGGADFLAGLPRRSRPYRTRTSLEQIIHTVISTLGLERDHVLSYSRQRDFTLARALIAWYATERRVASLSEVARRLRRDPSTLSLAISRHRARRPDLFSVTALHDVGPIAPIRAAPLISGWENAATVRDASDDREHEIVST